MTYLHTYILPLTSINLFVYSSGVHSSPPRWVSQHPAAEHYSSSGFPRSHPMYWTLPSRRTCDEDRPRYGRLNPEHRDLRLNLTPNPMSDNYYQNFYKMRLNSNYQNQKTISSQQNGAIEPSPSLTSAKLVQKTNKMLLSSTPTKDQSTKPNVMNLSSALSPILSPKTTMTSEEIFAAIHKSKKKLNIREPESRSDSPSYSSASLSPGSSECSLSGKLERSRDRLSWSPNPCEVREPIAKEPGSRKSWAGAGTSINAFKRLLLQQGAKKDSRLSAVEQLKLTKPDNTRGSVPKQDLRTPRAILNNRSKNHWRFASPRTDVLSSTILEDCSEVEKPEDTLKYRKEMERSSPLFIKNRLNGNPSAPKENGSIPVGNSIENTRKHLQQARLNFFTQPSTSPPKASLPFRKHLDFPKTRNLVPSDQRNGLQERRKTAIISLETAL